MSSIKIGAFFLGQIVIFLKNKKEKEKNGGVKDTNNVVVRGLFFIGRAFFKFFKILLLPTIKLSTMSFIIENVSQVYYNLTEELSSPKSINEVVVPNWYESGRIQIPMYAVIFLLAVIGNSLVILTLVRLSLFLFLFL